MINNGREEREIPIVFIPAPILKEYPVNNSGSKEKEVEHLQITVVVWKDSITFNGWCSEEDAKNLELPKVTTIGFLVNKTDDCIILAQSTSNKTDFLNLISIPLTSIDHYELPEDVKYE